jgi:hypothetical protein
MNVEAELAKLKYHVELLSEALPSDRTSYASLAIELNWGRDDMDRAHNIFEKHDKLLEATGRLDGVSFEHELRESFSIGYQEVKPIVLAFWDHDQWQSVCKEYASQNECVEFHGILGRE